MDSRKNWILVDAVSSQTNAPIRVGGRSFPATHSREETRLENINRLNERIHRRLAEQDDGVRVVEENFRFIEDEPTERLDSLIAQRDSRGEVEAIFERRQREYGRRIEPPRMWPAIEEVPEPAEGEEEDEEPIYKNSPALYLEPSSRFEDQRFRRRTSLDSTATRVIRPDPINRPPFVVYEERRPVTTLRRTPLFYDKCDLCAYKIFRTGDFCPACGRSASPLRLPSRSPRGRPYTEMLLSAPRLVYEPWANRTYSNYYNNMSPRRQFRAPRGTGQNGNRRRTQRPVFRYGSSLPEALYDYEVWARKKDRRRFRRKAAALAFALLALALVISAGVVLAAIRY